MFDIVFCDYGAMTFADPYLTVPEVARLLRPGGLFAFNHASPIRQIAWPLDAERAGDRLVYDYFGMHEFDDGETIDFNLPYGEWIRLFRAVGLHDRGPHRTATGRGRPELVSRRPRTGVVAPLAGGIDLAATTRLIRSRRPEVSGGGPSRPSARFQNSCHSARSRPVAHTSFRSAPTTTCPADSARRDGRIPHVDLSTPSGRRLFGRGEGAPQVIGDTAVEPTDDARRRAAEGGQQLAPAIDEGVTARTGSSPWRSTIGDADWPPPPARWQATGQALNTAGGSRWDSCRMWFGCPRDERLSAGGRPGTSLCCRLPS